MKMSTEKQHLSVYFRMYAVQIVEKATGISYQKHSTSGSLFGPVFPVKLLRVPLLNLEGNLLNAFKPCQKRNHQPVKSAPHRSQTKRLALVIAIAMLLLSAVTKLSMSMSMLWFNFIIGFIFFCGFVFGNA